MWVDLTKCHKCVTWAHIVIITHMHIQIHTRTHAYAVTSLHIWAHTHLEIERYREPHNEWDYCTFLIPDLFCSLVVVWIVHLLFCSWALLCVWVPSSVSSSATLYFSPASWHVPHKSPNSWATVSMCHYHSSLLYPQETMLIDALSSVSSHGAPRLSLSLSLCVFPAEPRYCARPLFECPSHRGLWETMWSNPVLHQYRQEGVGQVDQGGADWPAQAHVWVSESFSSMHLSILLTPVSALIHSL